MKNSFKIIAAVALLLFFVIGGYFLIFMTLENDILLSENNTSYQFEENWVRENSPEESDGESLTRNVELPDGSFENQLISISRYKTELDPEEWTATQIDLNDVLVMTFEWGDFNGYKHLSITSKTISDDAKIDYFFKDYEVMSFTFQPLHALDTSDNEDFYLRIIAENSEINEINNYSDIKLPLPTVHKRS